MRREWQDAIDNRRWDEFERLIKWEPEQELCDTLALVADELTDKADRKAIKRLLWQLEKVGLRPMEKPEEAAAETKAPLEVAFMMSADAIGDTPITYGVESGGKFRWMTAYVHEVHGIRRASDETMSLEAAQERINLLKLASSPPYLSGSLEPKFALWRIKRALAKNKPGTVPPAIAFWRSIIDKATELTHPSKELKAGKTKASERAEDVLLMESTLSWRIELGAATPIMEAMYMAQEANKDADEDKKSLAVKEAGVEARKAVLTEEILAEHAMRLRDLAYLMNQRGDETFSKILASAEELEKKGVDSEYAKGLVDKTVVIYVETMKRAEEKGD